jgi:urocanate hydratase
VDDAIDAALAYAGQNRACSVGVDCNAVELLERLIEREIAPGLLTDQTSAHDVLNGYVPIGMTVQEAADLRRLYPDEYTEHSLATMERHVRAMVELQRRGSRTFDYGNNIRQRRVRPGVQGGFQLPGFVPAYIRPQFCVGRGPFRWVALSGDPQDIFTTDEALMSSSRPTRGSIAGCAWPASGWRSRACRPVSAGWDWENATRRGCCSMTWSPAGESGRRS